MRIFLLFLAIIFVSAPAFAAKEAFRSTDYPLPRFVSLAKDKVYVRTGPGQRYPIKWVFEKKHWPVEIILEFDHWRKIRDHDGDSGWVHTSLLSGKRTALTQAEGVLRRKPGRDAPAMARLESGAFVAVEACRAAWCDVNAGGYQGWIPKKDLWGVYGFEEFE